MQSRSQTVTHAIKLAAATILAAGGTASAQSIYSTSFENPPFSPGTSLIGVDGWQAASGGGEGHSVSDAFASLGSQSLLWDQTGSFLGTHSVRQVLPAGQDPVSASVDLWISSVTSASRTYGMYFVSSPTALLSATSLGLTIEGDGRIRGGRTYASTWSSSGLLFTAEPGTYTDRWLTLTLVCDPVTGDGEISVSGLGGAIPSISFPFGAVSAPRALHLGTDWPSSQMPGLAYMDNLVIEEVPGPSGACCLPDGSCVEVRSIACGNQGGTYHGDGTTCATTPPGGCPQPPTGSCCFVNGTCAELWSGACAAQGGAYNGDGTTCLTAPCPGSGACCFANGGCTVIVPSVCATMSGVFHGENTTCAAMCPPPTDVLVPPPFSLPPQTWATNYTQTLSGTFNATGFALQVDAAPTGGGWHSEMVMRLESPNGTVLLIGADYSAGPPVPGSVRWSDPALSPAGTRPGSTGGAQFIDVTYMYDFGPVAGDWKINFFNNSETAGETPWSNIRITPSVTGACCLPTGPCTQLPEPSCAAAGGAYRGGNTLCATVTPACPGLFVETVDAGEVPDTAAHVAGEGSLIAIQGTLAVAAADLADVFKISICDFQNFSATTVGQTSFFTTLGLFNEDGTGVVLSVADPADPQQLGSTLTSLFVQANGDYYLSISIWPNYPADAGGALIWSDSSAHWYEQYAPNGPGALNPLGSWVGLPQLAGAYSILLTGACFLDATPPCYANCDGSTVPPILNVDDFTCFINEFAAAQGLPHAQQVIHYANCDGSTVVPILNVDDFTCFINAFAAGCP